MKSNTTLHLQNKALFFKKNNQFVKNYFVHKFFSSP